MDKYKHLQPDNCFIPNDETILSRQNRTTKNIRVQTELTASGVGTEANIFQKYAKSKNIRVQTTLTGAELNGPSNVSRLYSQGEDLPILHQTDQTHQGNQTDITIDSDHINNSNSSSNQQVIDINNNNVKTKNPSSSSPIEGYADEPLLSLVDACEPLTDVLHNLSFYVELALNQTPREPPDRLSVDESAAIRLYTIEWDKPYRSLYSDMNYHLKTMNREKLLPYFRYLKLFITALVKLPCVPPLT
ncbi:unnamed protein product, partial [Adineta ricciae]